jgi:uncharacterized repeat protein (TIGR03806 family)
MRAALLLALLVASIALGARAVEPQRVDQAAIDAARPPLLLSAYHFFQDSSARDPTPGVTPYDLNTPLYSDGALKFRYLYLPPGQQAAYRADGVFEFPVGAVLIKTFAFAADMRTPSENVRFLETRLLIHRADGWVALAYVWNEAQTEARLSPIGATIPTRFIDEAGEDVALDWLAPNRNQCAGCHARAGAIQPIGPTARNLNRDMPSVARYEDQVSHWQRIGLLIGAPAAEEIPAAPNAYDPASGTLDARARTYLDVNCAHCHNPQGPANTSGLDLRWNASPTIAWGVRKRPVAAGRGSAGMEFAIDPGHPERSILVHRMESTDPGVMMPELGRQLVDERAVALMRGWIAEMDESGAP